MKRAGTVIFGLVMAALGGALFVSTFITDDASGPASPGVGELYVVLGMVSLVLTVGGIGAVWAGLTGAEEREQRRIIESGRRTAEREHQKSEEERRAREARQEADRPRREAEIARLAAEREEGERVERQRVDVERRERDARRQARIEVRAA